MKRFSITVPDDMHNWILEQAEQRGLTMNAIVVLALEQYRGSAISVAQLEELKTLLQINSNCVTKK